jgi:hypothetical protein
MWASMAVVGFAVAYGAVLLLGFASLDSPDTPIEDPWFTILELLIVAMMPAMVALMAAIHASATKQSKSISRWALVFMIATAAVTMAVHVCLLVLRRSALIGEHRRVLLTFEWPSVPYALDILAWDVFFALAMLCAAPLFGGSRLGVAIRVTMTISGILALVGLAGPLLGDMRLRNIGVLGYAGVFPVAAVLLAMHFRRERDSERA